MDYKKLINGEQIDVSDKQMITIEVPFRNENTTDEVLNLFLKEQTNHNQLLDVRIYSGKGITYVQTMICIIALLDNGFIDREDYNLMVGSIEKGDVFAVDLALNDILTYNDLHIITFSMICNAGSKDESVIEQAMLVENGRLISTTYIKIGGYSFPKFNSIEVSTPKIVKGVN